jgi:hypothetical protein
MRFERPYWANSLPGLAYVPIAFIIMSEGIHYVSVNGQVALDNGVETANSPGRGLRKEKRNYCSEFLY